MQTVTSVLAQLTKEDAATIMGELADSIRIVSPYDRVILFDQGSSGQSGQHCTQKCHEAWESGELCIECVSRKAIETRQKQVKIEVSGQRIFLVTAVPVHFEQNLAAVEIIRDVTNIRNIQGQTNLDDTAFQAKFAELMLSSKINSYTNEAMSIRELLQHTVENIQFTVGLDEVALYFKDQQTWFSGNGVDCADLAAAIHHYVPVDWQTNRSWGQCFHFRLGQSETISDWLTRNGWAAIVGIPIATSKHNYGYMVLCHGTNVHFFRQEWIGSFQRLAEQIAIAIKHDMLLTANQGKEKLEAEMRLAMNIHRNLLPKELPDIPECQAAVAFQPAAFLGGDYYDFIAFGAKTAVIVGDIAGKGLGAAMMMVHLRSLVRAKAKLHRAANTVMYLLNELFTVEHNDEMLATLIYSIWDHKSHSLSYCNAGHPYPLLYRAATGQCERLEAGGLMIGVLPGEQYAEGCVKLAPEDVLVFYTDGITEADNGTELFGEERLRTLIIDNAQLSPEQIRDAVVQAVEKFSGCQSRLDDRMILVFKRSPAEKW